MVKRAQNINPDMLVWARKGAALSLEDAAAKTGISKKKLEAYEAKTDNPTRNQLFTLARVYRQSLITFYLENPPQIAQLGKDFRRLARHASEQEEAILNALHLDIWARKDLVRGILEDDEDACPLDFIGSLKIGESVIGAADRIKERLEIKSDDWTSQHRSPDKLFTDLRERVESLGVFVLLLGNLGTYHTNISEKIFRGFAITDDLAPFIVINGNDARAARSFTLMHELVHLFVGEAGLSSQPIVENPRNAIDDVEKFCNNVAGEILLPKRALQEAPTFKDRSEAAEFISRKAEYHNLSKPMVAYRLLQMGKIDKSVYRDVNNISESKRKKDTTKSGGPDYYRVLNHHLGKPLVNLTGRALRDNQITHTTAARVLGLAPGSVEPFISKTTDVSGSYFPK